MTRINILGVTMISAVKFIVIYLLLTSLAIHAQCSKTIPLINDNLLHTKSTKELQNSRALVLLQKALTNLNCEILFVEMPGLELL